MEDPENEIRCPICYDVYIEPAVVSCGHLFCQYCIEQWSLRRNECPICRLGIKTVIKITNGNSIIDLAAGLTSEEARSGRAAAIRQRDADRKVFDNSKKRRLYPHHGPPPVTWNNLIVVEPPDNRFNNQNSYYQHHNYNNPSSRAAYNRRRYAYNHQRYNRTYGYRGFGVHGPHNHRRNPWWPL